MVKKKSSLTDSESPEKIFEEFTELCTLFVAGEEDFFLIPSAVPRLWHLLKRVDGDGDLLTMATRTLCLILESLLDTHPMMNRGIMKKLRECYQKITSFLTTFGENELYALPFKQLTPQDLIEELLKCISIGLKSSTMIDLLPSPHDQLQFCLLASKGSQWITCKALHHCMLMVRVEHLSSEADLQLLYNLLEEKLEGLSSSAKVDYDWDELLRTVTFCVISLQTHVHHRTQRETRKKEEEKPIHDTRIQGGTGASSSSSSSVSTTALRRRERKRPHRLITSVEEATPPPPPPPLHRKHRERGSDACQMKWKRGNDPLGKEDIPPSGSTTERRVTTDRHTDQDKVTKASSPPLPPPPKKEEQKKRERRTMSNVAGYSAVSLQVVKKYLHLLRTVGKRCPETRLQLLLACVDAVLVYPLESEMTDSNPGKASKDHHEGKEEEEDTTRSSFSSSSTLHVDVLTQLQEILARGTQRHAGFSDPFVQEIGGARGNDGGMPLVEESTEVLTLSNLQWGLPSTTWCALTVLAKLLAACPAMKRDYMWACRGDGDHYTVYRRKKREKLTHAFFSGGPSYVSLGGAHNVVDLVSMTDRTEGFMTVTSAVHFQPVPFSQVFIGAGHALPVTPAGDTFATRLLSTHEAVADALQAVLRLLCFGTTPTASLAKAVYLHTVCCSVPHPTEVVCAPFREMIARGAVGELQRVAHRLVGRPTTAVAWHDVLAQAGVWRALHKAKREEDTEEANAMQGRQRRKDDPAAPSCVGTATSASSVSTAMTKRKKKPSSPPPPHPHTPLESSLPYYCVGRERQGAMGLLPPPMPHSLSPFAVERRTPSPPAPLPAAPRRAESGAAPSVKDLEGLDRAGGGLLDRVWRDQSRKDAVEAVSASHPPPLPHQEENEKAHGTARRVLTDQMVEAICHGDPTAMRCFMDACGAWGEAEEGEEGRISVQETAQVLQKLRVHLSKEVEDAKEQEGLSSAPASSSCALSLVWRSALESYLARLYETVTMASAARPLIPTVGQFPPSSVYVCQEEKEGEEAGEERQDGEVLCPQKHPLTIFHGSAWRCDGCRQQTAYGSYACRRCNYDLCYACVEKSSRRIPVCGTTTIGDVLHSWKQVEQAGASRMAAVVVEGGGGCPIGERCSEKDSSHRKTSPPPPPTHLSRSTESTEAIPFVLERRSRHPPRTHHCGEREESESRLLPLVSPAFLHPSIHIASTTASPPFQCREAVEEEEGGGRRKGTATTTTSLQSPHGKWYTCDTLRTERTPLAMVLHAFGEVLFRDRRGGVLLGLYGALEGIATDLVLFGVQGIPPLLQDVLLGGQQPLPCSIKREVVHFMAVDCVRYARAALTEAHVTFPGAIQRGVGEGLGERQRQPFSAGGAATKAHVPRGDLPKLTAVLWDTLRQMPPVANPVEWNFEGEEGTGNGPTQEVYAEMCRLFQQEKSLWYTREDGTSFVCPSHTMVHAKAFFVLGAACGRGFVDDYLIELPLLTEVWGLIRYGAAVGSIGKEEEEDARRTTPTTSPTRAPPFLDASSSSTMTTTSRTVWLWRLLACVDEQLYSSYTLLRSATPDELEAMDIADEEDRPIRTTEAAEAFVQRRVEAHFQHTLTNVWYFQLGLSSTVDLNFFWFFSEQELSEVFCGVDNPYDTSLSPTDEMGVEKKLFTEEEFRSMVEEAHGYEPGSPIVAQMIAIVCHSFTRTEQRYFLEFLTGTSRLPPSGICGLGRKITVVKKDMEGRGEATLPSCSTCFLYLKLPPYSSEEIMRKRLLLAVTEGRRYFSLS